MAQEAPPVSRGAVVGLKPSLSLGAVLVLLSTVAALSLPSQAGIPTNVVNAVNFSFDPPAIVVFSGESVVFNAVDGCHGIISELGTVSPAFIEDDGGAEGPAGSLCNEDDDDGVIAVVTFSSSGVWVYNCPVPTHRERGMVGVITVI